MRKILSIGTLLAAAAVGASSAAAADPIVPFPAPKVGPVFIAAQTVTTGGAMTNYFAPGSTVVFRAYAVDTKTKTLVSTKTMRYFYVKIPGQPNVKLAYKPTAPGATKGMPWVGTWTIPASFAAGNVPIDIRIKLKKTHQTGQFVQMPVVTAMLTVSAAPPAAFVPAPTGAVGQVVPTSGKVDLSLYVDSVNGSRPVGAAPRQVGCSQTNVYKRGEQVVFRAWGMDLTDGTVLSADNVNSAVVTMAGQAPLTLNWGAHGNTGAKVWFWTTPWIVPATFPLGNTVAHVVFKTENGKTATFDYALNIIP